jgi:ribonuclease-3
MIPKGVKPTTTLTKSEMRIEASRLKALQEFQQKSDIHFHDSSLLNLALTHSSAVNEMDSCHDDNERLEFLGDSVLGLCIAQILFEEFQTMREGDLALMKNVLASEATLAEIAAALGINEYLILGKGEEMSGGRHKMAILADATEALLGAYYLDSDMDSTKVLVQKLYHKRIEDLMVSSAKDYKSIIQEYAQKQGIALPVYSVERSEGPEHARLFFVSCAIEGQIIGPFPGRTKKEAEQRAAREAFDILQKENPEHAKLLDRIAHRETGV